MLLDDHSTGEQTINGQEVYFNNDGIQIKGDFSGESYSYPDQTFYYDSNSGARVRKEGLFRIKRPNLLHQERWF